MLTYKVDDKGARAKLGALLKAANNPQGAFRTVGNTVLNRIRLCFKLGIDPWGTPWAPLKIRKGGQPLRDTGRLQRSITAKTDATGVTIGTNLRYAPVHQFGAEIVPKVAKRLVFPGPNGAIVFAKKVTIPGRPYMPLRRDSSVVALPPAWSSAVVRDLKAFFLRAAAKETTA